MPPTVPDGFEGQGSSGDASQAATCGRRLLNNTVDPQNAERLKQQTILAKFGELALQSDDLDEILTEACHLVGQALGTDLAKVMELQDDGETLLVRAGVGWKPGVVGGVTLKVQVLAVPDRQRRQGGRQRHHHRRQRQAAIRRAADRQPRAPALY